MEVRPSIAQMNQLVLLSAGGGVVELLPDGGQRLSIPAGAAGEYRLAQLDDTQHLPRSEFRWQSPCILELRARVSAADLPGTWGFGLWNDPFSASLGVGGGRENCRFSQMPPGFSMPPAPTACLYGRPARQWTSGSYLFQPQNVAAPARSCGFSSPFVILAGDSPLDPPDST